MSITVEEKFDSRELVTGASASAELLYIIRGTADDLAAKAALEAAAPGGYDGLERQSCHVEPVHIDAGNDAVCVWDGAASYAPYGSAEDEQPPPETGDSIYSFDTGGGTQHITQSIFTRAGYSVAGNLADFKGAIGVTHDSVEGVDITTPVYNFFETHYIPNSSVTEAYRYKLFLLTGKTNDANFRGMAAGEVLFLGASGSKRSAGDWEIAFRFAASPNRLNITVGGITDISKKGWEYMWVRYVDSEDAGSKTLIKVPQFVYIEVVYEDGNFPDLGIGA